MNAVEKAIRKFESLVPESVRVRLAAIRRKITEGSI
jgi:hypothetical protein